MPLVCLEFCEILFTYYKHKQKLLFEGASPPPTHTQTRAHPCILKPGQTRAYSNQGPPVHTQIRAHPCILKPGPTRAYSNQGLFFGTPRVCFINFLGFFTPTPPPLHSFLNFQDPSINIHIFKSPSRE